MVVSDTHRFLFFHTPKTGGKSLTRALKRHATPDNWSETVTKHDTPPTFRAANLERMEQRGLSGPGLDGFAAEGWFRFAFVRNPWDRMLSLYSFLKARPADRLPEARMLADFSEFVRRAEQGEGWITGLHSMRPQADFTTDERGRPALDHIGRFETFDEDIARIGERLGLRIRTPHLNRSEHAGYREVYDPASRDAVGRLFADDIERFDYEF